MAPRKGAARIDVLFERAVDLGVDAMFGRVEQMIVGSMEQQQATKAAIPADLRRSAYKCAGCHKMFPFEQCEMISATSPGFATCKGCFKFMWDTANDKMLKFKEATKEAMRGAHGGAHHRAPHEPAAPRMPKPWEVLGIDADATLEEVKKAYRKLAAAAHPDLVPPGASTDEKDAVRNRFEALTRAYNAMVKVRSAPQ